MTKSEKKQTYGQKVKAWGTAIGTPLQDLSVSLIKFVPDGLEGIYDNLLTRIPLLGRLLKNEWIAKFIKALTGITLIQMVATDLGRFIVAPIGFYDRLSFWYFLKYFTYRATTLFRRI